MAGSVFSNPIAFDGLQLDGSDYMIDNKFGSNERDSRGHMKDGGYKSTLQGKLPWHPTFSNESPYASKDKPGGSWFNGMGILPDTFTPSIEMIQDGRANGLSEYFKKFEQGNKLKAPTPYDTNSSFFQNL